MASLLYGREYEKTMQKRKNRLSTCSGTCRGHCDSALAQDIRSQTNQLVDGWEDISDVMMPIIFIKWVMSILNEQRNGVVYSEEAFKSLKEFMLQVFPYVSRHLTAQETERVKSLGMIPSYLGGLDYES